MTWRPAVLAAVLLLALGSGTAAAEPASTGPAPVYAATVGDAVTPAAANGVPPANSSKGDRVTDSYTADTYERPFALHAGRLTSLPAVDIASARAGAGSHHLYYRIDLSAVDPVSRTLPHSYAFEVDYDDDPAGDLLVRVDDPGAGLGAAFGTAGVSAFWNENSNATGPNPGSPDGPGATPDGYEAVVFEQGTNRIGNAQGGDDALQARIAPDRSASVEVAVESAFLQALNADLPVTKVSFRPGASRAPLDHRSYYLHDKLGRAEAGSPYPFLQRAGAPAACPESDVGLSPEQRSALDSGTDVATGLPNPCHDSRGLSAYDNAAFVTVAPGVQPAIGQAGPDLSVTAFHAGRFTAGRRSRITVVVRNGGNGRTTAPVSLVAPLPPGLGLISATGRGWGCTPSGQEVACRRPAALAPGATTFVVLTVAAGPGAAPGATLSFRVATVGDADSSNDTAIERVAASPVAGARRRQPLVLIGLGVVFLGSLVAWRRLKRADDLRAREG